MPQIIYQPKDEENIEALRLDQFLATQLNISRSQIQKLIKQHDVLVNKKATRPSYIINPGDEIDFNLGSLTPQQKLNPQLLPLDIVYEDSALIVVNKPRGISVHPGASLKQEATLVEGVLHHCGHLSNLFAEINPLRPGVVHRLDRDTTGLIVFAKTNQAHQYLQTQFKKKTEYP